MSKNNFFCRIFAIFQIAVLIFSLSPNLFAQKPTANTPQTVFSNTTPITINTTSGLTAPTKATVYPSTIDVSGMTGTITRVAVTLDGFNTTLFRDADFLLVSPTGAKYIFLSDAANGANVSLTDRIFTFADDAAAPIGNFETPPSGNYKPTNGDTTADTFPAPAPAGPYNQPNGATFASVFNGADPNGTWSLYAVDDTAGNAGSINGGWALTVTTGGAPATFANSNYIGLHDRVETAAPYGTIVNVSGVTGVISKLTVTINGLSHTIPQDIDVLLVSPNGIGLILMSDVGGNTAAADANLTFDDAAPTMLSGVVTGTYRPTDIVSESFGDFFAAPAPFPPFNQLNQLSVFNGYSPNGEWRLFVVDDAQNNAGTISGGWSLDVTTVPAVPPTTASCSAPSFSTNSFMTGLSPTNVAVADYNNDNKADLAVANQVTNDVSVLLGNGDGTFGGQSLFSAGSGPYGIVAGKFNADNNWDLAVTNSGSNNVSILLGNGSGGFSAAANFFVGASPLGAATGDFNNDGKADLAVANFGGFFTGSVSILLGTGTGAFTTGTSVRTRSQPSFVAVARFNADANDDIIVANFGSDSVSTYFGNGAGGFQLQQNISMPGGPVSIEVADLGTDGILDIAVANYNSDTVTTCPGTLSGGFGSCSTGAAGGNNPISVTAADFVGGGIKSTATALSGSNWVRVLTSTVSVGTNPNAIESADFNGDGKPDIVSVNYGSNDVTIMINSCLAAKGNIFDYNGDRRTDFSVFRPATQAYFVQSLNGTGPYRTFGRPTDKLVPADYNGDLRTDFAVYRPSNGLWFVSDQSQRTIYFLQFGLPEDIPVPADYDGDGKADIAVFRPSNGNWYIRLSSENSVATVAFGMNGDKPVAADFDGDGRDDIGVFRPSTGDWYIAKSTGGYIITHFGMSEDLTVAGDYDGDGKADIAVWRPSTGAWYVLKSSDGGFIATGWGQTGDIPVPGDYEGDGKYDFAVWRPADNIWYIRKSSDNGEIYFQWGVSSDIPIPSSFVR
ncbi:MAG TPA: VCBS repeat-containing protein [Pyrinomonadaceae bacterium]